MERSTIFKFGKPSIIQWAIEKPWRTVSHNQRVSEIDVKTMAGSTHPPSPSARALNDGGLMGRPILSVLKTARG